MGDSASHILLNEDWSAFEPGPLARDNSAHGEYMCRTAPDNPHGWYQPSSPGWASGHGNKFTSVWAVEEGPDGEREICQTVHAADRILCLTQGEESWTDYTVEARVNPGETQASVGLIARYTTSRDLYAGVRDYGQFKILKRVEGMWTVLALAPADETSGPFDLKFILAGNSLTLAVNNRELISCCDGSLPFGGTGLLALGPARFGALTVCTPEKPRQIEGPHSDEFPAAELALEIDLRGIACGRQLRLADLTGDGRCELLFGLPRKVRGTTWNYHALARLTALDLDGNTLWQINEGQAEMLDITQDLPFQAGPRKGGMEVTACFENRLMRLDPQTGKVLQEALTPQPPHMEPYWDEISQYFGDGHGDDLPHLIPDAIRLCNLTGQSPYHDILIKDRYHNAWGLDGGSLEVLWHHRCNIGHYPFAWDPDNSGRDTILLGYSRLDHSGKLVGRLFLGDHPDACFAYIDDWKRRHMLHPSGEAGLIDERSDGHVGEVHLGHVQHVSVANFRKDLPGLERIVVMFHGGEGIIVLLDHENRVLRKTEKFASGAVCQPVNWTGDGQELIGFSPRIGDGGLWDADFNLVVALPDTDRPERCMEVHDVLGLGVDQLIIWDDEKLQVYKPATVPANGGNYAPVKAYPNLSNYQVNYSLPAWKA